MNEMSSGDDGSGDAPFPSAPEGIEDELITDLFRMKKIRERNYPADLKASADLKINQQNPDNFDNPDLAIDEDLPE